MTEEIKDITEEKVQPIEIIDKTPPKPKEDKTSWETPDPYETMTMTEKDIEEAEESRHA